MTRGSGEHAIEQPRDTERCPPSFEVDDEPATIPRMPVMLLTEDETLE